VGKAGSVVVTSFLVDGIPPYRSTQVLSLTPRYSKNSFYEREASNFRVGFMDDEMLLLPVDSSSLVGTRGPFQFHSSEAREVELVTSLLPVCVTTSSYR
jgi:hypothetical protein